MKFAVSKGEKELSELTARIFDIKGRGAAEAAKKAEAALLKANPHIADLTKIPEGTLIVIPDLTDNPPVKGTQTAALSGDLEDGYGVHFESSPTGTHEGEVFRYAVTPQYFATMGIPIVRGRSLDDGDRANAPLAVVVNQRFAKRKFPDGNALGQHLHIGPDRGPWFTIVGIAGDVRQLSLAGAHGDAVYLTPAQSWFADGELSVVARIRGEPLAFAPAIKSAIWSIDRNQPILRVQTMDNVVSVSAAERHFALVVFEAFAIVALLLAATGIYGVLSGSVTERMREIGVRSALGASSNDILSLVMRQGMALTLLGVVLGLIGAGAGSRLLVTLLFGVSRMDFLTYTGVVALLVGVSAIACWLPAYRASKVDPAITLRSE